MLAIAQDVGRHVNKITSGCIFTRPNDRLRNPSGKGKRLIVLNIGSEEYFIPDALLCFESKKILGLS